MTVVLILLVIAILFGAYRIMRNGIVTNRPGDSAASRGAEAIGRMVILLAGAAIIGFIIFTQVAPPPAP